MERSIGVADAIDRQALRPDVLLVHDGRLAAYARGHVATVLDGHLHRTGTEVVNGTRTLQAGTAGAAGPTTSAPRPPVPTPRSSPTPRPAARWPSTASPSRASSSFSVERSSSPRHATPFTPDPLEVPPDLVQTPGAPGADSLSPSLQWSEVEGQQFFRCGATGPWSCASLVRGLSVMAASLLAVGRRWSKVALRRAS